MLHGREGHLLAAWLLWIILSHVVVLLLLNFRCKLLHQASSPAGMSFDPGTPTKPSYTRSASLPAESHLVTCANPAKVSCKKQLECLAQLYSSCIAGEDTEDVRLTSL